MTKNLALCFLMLAVVLRSAIFCPVLAADRASGRRSPSAEETERLWPEKSDFLPPRFRAAPSAKLVKVVIPGKVINCFDQIHRTSESGPVPFLLIPADGNQRAFYLMKHKVWYNLFRQFDSENPAPMPDLKWKLTAQDYATKAKLASPAKLPAFNIEHDRARSFAKWLGGESGDLPTKDQWDRAAGWQPDKTEGGPYQLPKDGTPPEIAIGRNCPCEYDQESQNDISPFGCWQMAGNGKEWTRTPLDVLFEQSRQHFVLRGRSFTASKPLSYEDYKSDQFGTLHAASPFLTFRVAIEIK